jgi:hypothetical protein
MEGKVDLSEAYRLVRELELDIPFAKQILLNEVFYDLSNYQYQKGMEDATTIHNKYR